MTLLAVPITHAAVPLVEQEAQAVAQGAGMIELRVDQIGDVAAVEAYLRGARKLPAILTIRAADEGGAWDSSEAERIALIERLGLLHPGYVDVELSAWSRSANIRQKIGLVCERISGGETLAAGAARGKNRLILSAHRLRPGDPAAEVYSSLETTPAEVLKLAITAVDARGAFEALEVLHRRAGSRPLIAIAMGDAGTASRVLAKKFGAFLTFASLDAKTASAAGQLTIATLRDTYAWDRIGPETAVYGVVGWPVSHSRSPLLHNLAMTAAGIDGVYVPLPVREDQASFDEFMDFVGANPWLGVRGLSVTIPHKEHAYAWLRSRGFAVRRIAAQSGAVNTLIRLDAGWTGENTDAGGALAALREAGVVLSGRPILILGAGGAARAIVAALRENGARVCICNRTRVNADRLAELLPGAKAIDWDARVQAAADADVIVNCTPIGMSPQSDETPIPPEAIREQSVVFDTVYTPGDTRLLREARARGANTISGVRMFIQQAAAQFSLWHGRPAPLEAIRAVFAP